MKRLLVILTAAVMAAACTDKVVEYTPADSSQPIYATITYNTALAVSRQTANRTTIYDINGRRVVLSVVYDDVRDKYQLRADRIAEANDGSSILDCEIDELGFYKKPSDVRLSEVDDDFFPFAVAKNIPDAEEYHEYIDWYDSTLADDEKTVNGPEATAPTLTGSETDAEKLRIEEEFYAQPTVWHYECDPDGDSNAFIVRYVGDGLNLHFVVVVSHVVKTRTWVHEVVDMPPFGDPVMEWVPYYQNAVSVMFKPYRNGKWIN